MSDLARVNTSEFHSSALYSYSRFPTAVTSCYGLMARLIEGFKEQWTRVVPVSAQSMSLTVSRTFALTRYDDAPSFEEGGASISDKKQHGISAEYEAKSSKSRV